jgi:hypothetical protein
MYLFFKTMKLASIFAASCAILAAMAQAKPVESSHKQGQTGMVVDMTIAHCMHLIDK